MSLETGSLTEPGVSNLAGWLGTPDLQLWTYGHMLHLAFCTCYMLCIRTQVLTHTWQVLYQLNHLPNLPELF